MTLSRRTILQGTAAFTLGTTRIVRAKPAPIRLGVMLPMSGIGAEAGAAWLTGLQAAQLQWNEAGGLLGREIELVVRDDKFNSAGAVAAARELAGEGLKLIVGAAQSPMALAVSPILPELGAVLVAPAPTAMSLTHENFNRHFFRAASNAYMAFGGIGSMLAQRFPDIGTWTTILPDSENGRDMARYFQLGLERTAAKADRPMKVLEPVYVSLNKPSYRVEINSLMRSRADGLFVGLTAAPCVSLLQQGRAVGLDKKFKVIGEAGTELLIAKAMRDSTPDNLWGLSFWAPELEPFKTGFPESAKLMQALIKVSGNPHPPGIVQATHRSALAVFNAVKKAGAADTDAVINALEGLAFDTAAGPYQIRKEDHQGFGSAYFAKIAARKAAPGYGLEEVIRLDESQVIEPASPGKKFQI